MALSVLYIVPPTKSYAGIERVIDEICAELAGSCGNDVDIDVLFTSHFENHPIGERPYRKIQTDTKTRIGLLTTVRSIVGAKAYDLVVVPQVEATALFWTACLGLGRKFIVYLHGNPNLEMRSMKARMLFFLMNTIVLHRLAAVFGISKKQLASFAERFPSRTPHFWVPNPVRKFDGATSTASANANEVTFVNVGRFSYQKGQDILLRAFARLHATRPNARLKVVGYGVEEADLIGMIETLGLKDAVRIEHHRENPLPALAASDVYVSTSRWEGWSLAICEGLRFGLPVVSTDCDFGPSDILVDGRLGRLVPMDDEKALAQAMLYYCDNLQSEREHAGYRKQHVDQYSAANVVNLHAKALVEAGRRRQVQRPGQRTADAH